MCGFYYRSCQRNHNILTMKIEIRETCKVCGLPITDNRYRTFCSGKCRVYFYNGKYGENHTKWQRERRAKIAQTETKGKVQCLICKGWYVQVGSHIVQVHGMTAREYREQYGLEVKRGTVPEWYREDKSRQTLENGTVRNLEAGKKYQFKKGQKGVGVYKRSEITLDRVRNLKRNG